MCTAKRPIILFAIFTNSWRETIENKKTCKMYARFQTWPWTNRGTTYPGCGTAYLERGQGYQSLQLISCFLLKQNFGSPRKSSTIWVSIWILLMAQEFKHIQFEGYYSILLVFIQVLCYIFRSLGRNLLRIGLMTYKAKLMPDSISE